MSTENAVNARWMPWTLLAGLLLAGCAAPTPDPDGGDDTLPTDPVAQGTGTSAYTYRLLPAAYAFETVLIDDTRAGGEPVIAIAHDDSLLVATHPGWTHYHPTFADPDHTELVSEANAQSYLWRSTDQGATWTHIGLAGADGMGPRSTGTGFSDPDFTVDGTGRVWYTDLQVLAEQSVSYSDDNGASWTAGNVVAGAGPYVDRQWMGSHGDTVYLTANYFVDRSGGTSPDGARPFMTTDDDGLTWRTLGYAPCGGDFVADPRDGALLMGCGLGVAVSLDQGASWSVHESPAGVHTGFFAHEPAVDTAGGIALAANGQPLTPHEPGQVLVSYTPDRGVSWSLLDLTPVAAAWAHAQPGSDGGNGTHVFAWVSAGSPGRFAVSWIATAQTGQAPQLVDADWSVVTAFVTGLGTDDVAVDLVQVTAAPIHHGPMCQSGTTCQVNSVVLDPVLGTDAGDRRMGDFFETTVTRDGRLVMAFADTQARPDDVVSHPRFARQTAGPLLWDGAPWPEGWPLQG